MTVRELLKSKKGNLRTEPNGKGTVIIGIEQGEARMKQLLDWNECIANGTINEEGKLILENGDEGELWYDGVKECHKPEVETEPTEVETKKEEPETDQQMEKETNKGRKSKKDDN